VRMEFVFQTHSAHTNSHCFIALTYVNVDSRSPSSSLVSHDAVPSLFKRRTKHSGTGEVAYCSSYGETTPAIFSLPLHSDCGDSSAAPSCAVNTLDTCTVHSSSFFHSTCSFFGRDLYVCRLKWPVCVGDRWIQRYRTGDRTPSRTTRCQRCCHQSQLRTGTEGSG
jgi:hypothetical protein